MKLSFVIPAYNEEQYVGDCLEAILKEKSTAPCDVEIIVVNNASTDTTGEVARKYSGVTVVDEPKKGIVTRAAPDSWPSTGDLIANIDADTRITPGWIKKVVSEFSKDDKLVALSGPFVFYDLSQRPLLHAVFLLLGFFFISSSAIVLHVGSILQGGNFVVRRDALEKIGGFDTSINFYGEDTDVARRLNKVGNVKFTFDFPASSSGRRLAKEGGLGTAFRYTMNIFWITFFKRPFSGASVVTEVRTGTGSDGKATYQPQNQSKEVLIAVCVVIIFLVIIAAIGYGIWHIIG